MFAFWYVIVEVALWYTGDIWNENINYPTLLYSWYPLYILTDVGERESMWCWCDTLDLLNVGRIVYKISSEVSSKHAGVMELPLRIRIVGDSHNS